jgi:hypothetical protein
VLFTIKRCEDELRGGRIERLVGIESAEDVVNEFGARCVAVV